MQYQAMERLADYLCTEQSTYPAVSSKLLNDQRRLRTFLKQEERFMPNNYQVQKAADEQLRTNMLEGIYEVRVNCWEMYVCEGDF